MRRRYKLKVSDFARAVARASDAAESKKLGHARCVAHLAYLIGIEEELPPQALQTILLAGLIHDIGWISLGRELAGRVGDEPGMLLRNHPAPTPPEALGELASRHVLELPKLLRPLGLPRGVFDAVSMMHERWDGTGYPDALAGSEIPDVSLVLAAADHAISHLDAWLDDDEVPGDEVERLSALGGQVLDPELTQTMLDVLTDVDAWPTITSVRNFEAAIDDALYPIFGDFVEVDSHTADVWSEVLGGLADFVHPNINNHARKVRDLSARVAREMRLSPEEVREIEIASCFAELGRIGLPLSLLFRKGTFTQDERDAMRAYPTLGERILGPIRAAQPIFRAAVSHRERLNGSGYPEGLVGDEIPIASQIIAVSDTFIAFTHDREERQAYSSSVTLSILQKESTRLFDGLVVDALETVVKASW